MYEVKSSTLNVAYECKQTGIIVQGNYARDAQTNEIQFVNGTCYRPNEQGEIGENFGNFNGYMRNGELRFAISEMTRKDSNLTWGVIDEVEGEILASNEE